MKNMKTLMMKMRINEFQNSLEDFKGRFKQA